MTHATSKPDTSGFPEWPHTIIIWTIFEKIKENEKGLQILQSFVTMSFYVY